MPKKANPMQVFQALLSNLQILKVRPSCNLFLLQYMRKFRLVEEGGNIILHSHLPPINTKAFSRFINEHLLARTTGPSHAQIGVTNTCPQNCPYCYNKHRSGETLSTSSIITAVKQLKSLGVVWLGLTGGEPLLNGDLPEIIRAAGDDCSVKLFTTGHGLTKKMASDLRDAGLCYVSVSLDHWKEHRHDALRDTPGSFRTALHAIELLRNTGKIHIGVSSVLSEELLREDYVEEFIRFLIEIGVHEAWFSETKPSNEALWACGSTISAEEHAMLLKLQDRHNRQGNITINYLGHFEDRQHFGCNAGHKMVYVDSFGEVSPCVFTPISFGNIRERSLMDIFMEMRSRFPSQDTCFINKNYPLFKKYFCGQSPMSGKEAADMMREVSFGQYSKFYELYYR